MLNNIFAKKCYINWVYKLMLFIIEGVKHLT